MDWNSVRDTIVFICTVLQGAAAFLVIWIAYKKRDKIATAFDLLLNYSMQLTLTELKNNLESLNKLNVDGSADHLLEAKKLCMDISGTLQENKKLKDGFKDLAEEFQKFARSKSVPRDAEKRLLVSKLRERLREIEISLNSNKNTHE